MLKRALIFGCLILMVATAAPGADKTFLMPEDMQKLLPADPALIVAVTSVNELARHWDAIEEMMDDGSGERTDIVGLLSEQMPMFADYASMDRPLALVMGLPNLMAGQEPALTFIVPVTDSFDEAARLEMETEGVTLFMEGDYLAFSMDPAFSPSPSVPDLVQGLDAGFISASLDLEMVIAAYRPLAEMGLAALADTTGSGTRPPGALVTQGNAAEMLDLVRAVMDSAKRFDLAVQIDGEALTLHSGFSAATGSPLDPGPQPSFENALMLTRLLPEGGNFLQAMAMDQTRQFEVFRSFYTATIEKEAADMPPEQAAAYLAWIESYLDSIDLFANPVAASINMTADGMSANMVMECDDAGAALKRFADLFEGMSAADIGINMKKMPTGKVAGTEIHSWTVNYDAEKLAGLTDDPLNPQLAGAGRMQADQMVAILRKVTPNVNLAARGDYLILSADPDVSNLTHMIQMTDQSRAGANPEVAAAAAKAGPTCQQVVTGDMMAILAWVTEWMEELGDEELATIEGNPIPFTAVSTIDGASYGMEWTMDMLAMARFIKAAEALEAMDNYHNAEDEAESDHDGEAEQETDSD